MILILLSGLSAVLLAIIAFSAYDLGEYAKPFLQGQTIELGDGWVDSDGNSVKLPAKLPYRSDGYKLSRTLGDIAESQQSLLFSAKYLNVHLFLDNEEISSYMCRPEGETRTFGKVFTLVPLPNNLSGRTLRIEAEPLLGSDKQYEIIAPRIGAGGVIIYEIICDELPLLLTIVAIFCFGIFLLICGLQTAWVSGSKKNLRTYQANFLPIGLFAIMFSFYSTVITDTIHLFEANFYLIYMMEFLLLALLPLPLLIQASEVCAPRYKKILLADSCVVCINVFVQALLHLFAPVEFRDTVIITPVLIVVSIILLILALIPQNRYDKKQLWLPLSFSPVLVGAFVDIFRYYTPGNYQKAAGFQLGVLLFLLLQTAYLFHTNLLYYENQLKSSIYRQMAYTDALTGLSNRGAFEEKLKEIQENPIKYSDIWCLCADINNLKQANDTLGHAEGDALIKGTALGLQAAAEKPCEIYRIGGDEFIILLFDQEEQALVELRSKFDSVAVEYNNAHEAPLSVAFGYDRFEFMSGVDTVEKLLSRADKLMYEDKRRWKKINNYEYS